MGILFVVLGLVTLLIERFCVNLFAYWTLVVHLTNSHDFPNVPKHTGWKCAAFNLGILATNEKFLKEVMSTEFYISAVVILVADSCICWLVKVYTHCKVYHVHKEFNGLLVMWQVMIAAAGIIFYLHPGEIYFFVHAFCYLLSIVLLEWVHEWIPHCKNALNRWISPLALIFYHMNYDTHQFVVRGPEICFLALMWIPYLLADLKDVLKLSHARSHVALLPKAKVNHIKNPVCLICQFEENPMKPSNASVNVCCKSVFHSECLANWIKKENSCPICRRSTRVALDILSGFALRK